MVAFNTKPKGSAMSKIKAMPKINKVLTAVVVVALILCLLGGLLGAFIFAKSGPQGIQGEPGIDGTNSIQQVITSHNVTTEILDVYGAQWYDMSVFDSSMSLAIDINNQSRLMAEFVASVSLSNSAVWLRIVVDGHYVSTTCYALSIPAMQLPVQVKILTAPLLAGQHTIDVQFYQADGISTMLDRSLYVTEISPP